MDPPANRRAVLSVTMERAANHSAAGAWARAGSAAAGPDTSIHSSEVRSENHSPAHKHTCPVSGDNKRRCFILTN